MDPCEFAVPLVVPRNGHDGARPILHENEIPHPDGDAPARVGVLGMTPGEDPLLLLSHQGILADDVPAHHPLYELRHRPLLGRPGRQSGHPDAPRLTQHERHDQQRGTCEPRP